MFDHCVRQIYIRMCIYMHIVLPLRVQPSAGLLSQKILKQRGRLDKRKADWILDCQLFSAFVLLLYAYNRQPRDSWTP